MEDPATSEAVEEPTTSEPIEELAASETVEEPAAAPEAEEVVMKEEEEAAEEPAPAAEVWFLLRCLEKVIIWQGTQIFQPMRS